MPEVAKSGRVLIVAGSDSSGGAGIQADIKTITKLNGYAATAITAITVQNTKGVTAVHPVPCDIVSGQMKAVLSDIGADCIKLGMLFSSDIINTVADVLSDMNYQGALVLDPVMVATSGAKLIDDEAIETLKTRLLPLATIITPNVPEAEVLTGMSITNEEALVEAGSHLVSMGSKAALMKGGHLVSGDQVADVLVEQSGHVKWSQGRIISNNNHGTGCTLASAVAVGLAKGVQLDKSIVDARSFVRKAMLSAPDFGEGNGPMGHHLI